MTHAHVSRDAVGPMSFPTRVRLAFRVWLQMLVVVNALRRWPLPEAVSRLSTTSVRSDRWPAHRLSWAVTRAFGINRRHPRCLVRALVLFRLLRQHGFEPQLVIGLPEDATAHAAHAWVELDHRDVGPAPGRAGHLELARYG